MNSSLNTHSITRYIKKKKLSLSLSLHRLWLWLRNGGRGGRFDNQQEKNPTFSL